MDSRMRNWNLSGLKASFSQTSRVRDVWWLARCGALSTPDAATGMLVPGSPAHRSPARRRVRLRAATRRPAPGGQLPSGPQATRRIASCGLRQGPICRPAAAACCWVSLTDERWRVRNGGAESGLRLGERRRAAGGEGSRREGTGLERTRSRVLSLLSTCWARWE